MNGSQTQIFLATVIVALLVSTGLRLWLAARQLGCVRAHRGEVPSAFSGRIPLADHQKAADYTLARLCLGRITLFVELAWFCALIWGGLLEQMHLFWSARLSGLFSGLALVASVTFLAALIDLPFDIYRQFRLEARFGFNRMSPRLFFADALKGLLLFAVIGLPLLAAILWLVETLGSAWWLYAWVLWMGFFLFMSFVAPIWIAPFFNRFTPLEAGEVRDRVEALLERGKFGPCALFVMDGSRRSNHGNAYFTGFGASRRIVFFDTLLARLQPAEIEAVLAHELGHFHHQHIRKRAILIAVLSFFLLALVDALIRAPWFFQALGLEAAFAVPGPGNTALALVLLSLVLPLFTFPLAPLMSAFSRRHEFEADAYAARLACAPELISALVKLYRDNAATLTPDPFYSLFYDSHPPASLRIAHLESLRA
jgi:STE24 endopeptidase